MSQAHGHQGFIGWKEETAYNTPGTPTGYIELSNESLVYERKHLVQPLLGSVSQKNTMKGKKNVSGSIAFPFVWDGPGTLIKQALGSNNTTGTGPYTHTITPASDAPGLTPNFGFSFTVNRDATALGGAYSFRYAGCLINKLTLKQEFEQPLMIELDIIGADMAQVAKPTPTYPTFDPIQYDELASIQIDANGTPITLAVRNFELVIDNALDPERYKLGSAARIGTFRTGQRKITFSLEAEFTDNTAYAKFLAMTKDDWAFSYSDGGSNALVISLPNVALEAMSPTMDGPGPIFLPIEGQALYNAAQNDEISIALTNSTSTI